MRLTMFRDDFMDSKVNVFLMMKSVILCIRRSRSSKHEKEKHNVEELAR